MDDWSLKNAEMLQLIGAQQWSQAGNHEMFEKIATFRIGYELYQRLSGEREVDILRAQTIAAIAKYVQDNPKAKKEDLSKEIGKHVLAFAKQLEQL